MTIQFYLPDFQNPPYCEFLLDPHMPTRGSVPKFALFTCGSALFVCSF